MRILVSGAVIAALVNQEYIAEGWWTAYLWLLFPAILLVIASLIVKWLSP